MRHHYTQVLTELSALYNLLYLLSVFLVKIAFFREESNFSNQKIDLWSI